MGHRKPPERVFLAYRTKRHLMEEWHDGSEESGAIRVEYVRSDMVKEMWEGPPDNHEDLPW